MHSYRALGEVFCLGNSRDKHLFEGLVARVVLHL